MIITRRIAISCLLFLQIPFSATAEPFVDIQTTQGAIQVELFPDKAPVTVANFLKHVDNKFYDNKLFHRVIKDFMIQAGEPNSDLPQQDKIDLKTIALESTQFTGLINKRGTIAMARRRAPDTATAQFFINTVDNDFLDYSNSQSPGYAVFGNVTEGMDIVDSISQVQVDASDFPKEFITIESIRRHQQQEQPVVTTTTITPPAIDQPELPVTQPKLSFEAVQSHYVAGDTVIITVNESDTQRKEVLDLWIAVQLPNGSFLYLSKKETLSLSTIPFKNSVKTDENTYHALNFTVPKDLTGIYTFYAIFNKVDADINDLDSSLRSNIATIEVNLVESSAEK